MLNHIMWLALVSEVIEFSGFQWKAFENFDSISGNYFTSEGIRRDGDALLISCKTTKNDTGFVLYSSGIVSNRTFLYGIFTFEVEGDVEDLVYACFAPFLYDFSGGHFEVDIEYCRWGKPSNPPGNFGIIRLFGKWYKPDSVLKVNERFNFRLQRREKVTKHIICWSPDSVVFESFAVARNRKKSERLLHRWKVTDKKFIPNVPLNAEIYLWWHSNPNCTLKHDFRIISFEYKSLDASFYKNLLPGSPQVPKEGK
ncbi:MAG TPA: hypothetical protein PKU94_01325 [Candidatus Hydrothermia bacterium]|nr:hypothetical protein [Candidatus Hydrothermae bacterium]MDD3649822.1 hypothetical protein [Candidatus Hydrothermia bacterium]MDD5572467.1 hypothetical protein [Candidatus Hydrothermia bacterium]HOK23404.1 hypothetical protein [Candidatus Hydrothermia bacterium]HOL24214.1 hypothetical protein [Candidatus Hydrothermia bacterium]